MSNPYRNLFDNPTHIEVAEPAATDTIKEHTT